MTTTRSHRNQYGKQPPKNLVVYDEFVSWITNVSSSNWLLFCANISSSNILGGITLTSVIKWNGVGTPLCNDDLICEPICIHNHLLILKL